MKHPKDSDRKKYQGSSARNWCVNFSAGFFHQEHVNWKYWMSSSFSFPKPGVLILSHQNDLSTLLEVPCVKANAMSHIQVLVPIYQQTNFPRSIEKQLWPTSFLLDGGKHLDNSCHEFPATSSQISLWAGSPFYWKVRSKTQETPTPAIQLSWFDTRNLSMGILIFFPQDYPGFVPGVPSVSRWNLNSAGCAIDGGLGFWWKVMCCPRFLLVFQE